MCRVVIVECGLRGRRMRGGHFKKNQNVNGASKFEYYLSCMTECRAAWCENFCFGTLPGYLEQLCSNGLRDNVVDPICQLVHISESITILLLLLLVVVVVAVLIKPFKNAAMFKYLGMTRRNQYGVEVKSKAD